MESHIIDGNNILEVYQKVSALAESMRENPRPVLVEFLTFRRRGHEEASGTKYVPEDLMEAWELKDPISNYKDFLIAEGILTEEQDEHKHVLIKAEIEAHLQKAFEEDVISSSEDDELNDVYKPFTLEVTKPNETTEELRLIDAISQGLRQSMERYDDLVIMGQDVADYGGVFKITEGFIEQFGKDRVRNTPICESAIVSAAMGLSINGMKAVMEMQFGDFATSGFNPIVNYLAKSHYRWNPLEVYPAFPYDAKGLLATAIEDPNPVLFFEHKALYRSIRQDVPTDYFTIPFGKASLLKEGENITIITYGAGVHWALEVLEEHSNISADLIDLRSLQPLDYDTVYASVKKTSRVIILQEDSKFGGIASDLSACIMEDCFKYLDAPVKRVASLETPIPFAKNLENNYLPKNRFFNELLEVLAY